MAPMHVMEGVRRGRREERGKEQGCAHRKEKNTERKPREK